MSTHRGPVIFILFVVQQDFPPENRQLSFLFKESLHLWSNPSPSRLPLPLGSPPFNPSLKCPLQWQHTQSTHFWIMTTPHCNSVKYTLRQISFVFLMAPNLHHSHFQNRLLLHHLHLERYRHRRAPQGHHLVWWGVLSAKSIVRIWFQKSNGTSGT